MKNTSLLVILSFSLYLNAQYKIISSNIQSVLPNRFLVTDSGFYGLHTRSSSFDNFKSTPKSLNIISFDKFSNELKSLSIPRINGKSIEKYSLIDFTFIKNAPVVIFAKEEDEFIILYYAFLSNLNELVEFGKLEHTKLTLANTYQNARNPNDIQNIYMSKSTNGKSYLFYTYLKSEGKKVNFKCFDENLELKWSKQVELPVKNFIFGRVKETLVNDNGNILIKIFNNNQYYFFKYEHTTDNLIDVNFQLPENSFGSSKFFSNQKDIYFINTLEKKLANEFIGLNIIKLDNEFNILKNITLTEQFSSFKSTYVEVNDAIISENNLSFSLSDFPKGLNDYYKKVFPCYFVNCSINLEDIKVDFIQKPTGSSFTSGDGQVSTRVFMTENENSLNFLLNVGSNYLENLESNNNDLSDITRATKVGKIFDGKFSVTDIEGFQLDDNIIRSTERVNKEWIVFGKSNQVNGVGRIGLLILK
jgi:hypothetical protein